MGIIDKLWLATLTKDKKDAGTDTTRLNVTVDIDGEDLLDQDFTFMKGTYTHMGPPSDWLGRAQAAIGIMQPPSSSARR